MRTYENEMRRPLRNLVGGELVRALLIQVRAAGRSGFLLAAAGEVRLGRGSRAAPATGGLPHSTIHRTTKRWKQVGWLKRPRIPASTSPLCRTEQVQTLKVETASAMLMPRGPSLPSAPPHATPSRSRSWRRIRPAPPPPPPPPTRTPLPRPLFNIEQVQKLKVDTASAMLEMDQILKASTWRYCTAGLCLMRRYRH